VHIEEDSSLRSELQFGKFKVFVMLNLFQPPTCKIIILSVTQHVGSRNKFRMTKC